MEATLDLTAMMEMIVVRSACILLMYITAAMPFSEASESPWSWVLSVVLSVVR